MAKSKRFIKAIAILFVSLFAIFYAYMQIIGISNDDLELESALSVTYEQKQSTEGYIFRNENVITYGSEGTLLTVVNEGTHVAAGSVVANLFSNSSDVDIQSKIDDINTQLSILNKSNISTEYFSADIEKISNEIESLYKNIQYNKSKNSLSECVAKYEELLVSLNMQQIASGSSGLGARIDMLQGEKNSLINKLSGDMKKITTDKSGFFSSDIDGFENVFTVDKIEQLTVDSFNSLIEQKPNDELKSSAAGKIITDYVWYCSCALPVRSAMEFVQGRYYNIEFPYSYSTRISMKLEKLIIETDKNEGILVFSSNTIPENFNYLRSQKIDIITNSYSGLNVRESAVRVLDGVQGVYVLVGDTVEFRRAKEVFELGDNYIISTNGTDYETSEDDTSGKYKKLSLYDMVIISGKELYHGKRIQ